MLEFSSGESLLLEPTPNLGEPAKVNLHVSELYKLQSYSVA